MRHTASSAIFFVLLFCQRNQFPRTGSRALAITADPPHGQLATQAPTSGRTVHGLQPLADWDVLLSIADIDQDSLGIQQ
jgi:hypothetical protein